mmetsp:Transcript_40385/g.89675  ORF Transcript_40385/g.89675 Transcript_40385/m.89675 type:complete len:317 (+) Transcript_40385:732-1682(+)
MHSPHAMQLTNQHDPRVCRMRGQSQTNQLKKTKPAEHARFGWANDSTSTSKEEVEGCPPHAYQKIQITCALFCTAQHTMVHYSTCTRDRGRASITMTGTCTTCAPCKQHHRLWRLQALCTCTRITAAMQPLTQPWLRLVTTVATGTATIATSTAVAAAVAIATVAIAVAAIATTVVAVAVAKSTTATAEAATTTATATIAAAAKATATTAAGCRPVANRCSLIHADGPAHVVGLIQFSDGRLGSVGLQSDEAKAAGATSLAISGNEGVLDGSKPAKQLLQFVIGGLPRQVADVQLGIGGHFGVGRVLKGMSCQAAG